MRAVILGIVLLAACGDNNRPATNVTPDAAEPDAPMVNPLAPCLEHFERLPTPSDQLPCELLPPDFVAP